MTSLPRRLLSRRDPGLRDAIRLGGNTAAAQVLVAFSTPVLTRLYSPQDFGALGLITALVAFAAMGAGLTYELAIMSAATKRDSDALLLLVIITSVPVATLTAVVTALLAARDVLAFGVVPLWTPAAVATGVVFTSVFLALRCWHVYNGTLATISAALLAQGAGRALLPALFAFVMHGAGGLIAGEIGGRCAGVVRLLRPTRLRLARVISRTSHELRRVAVLYRRYPLLVLPSTLINAGALALPLPVLAAAYGADAGGHFLLVTRVAALPASLVAASVGDIYHREIVQARLAGVAFQPIFRRWAFRLAVVALLVWLPVGVVSPYVFSLLFGVRWVVAGDMMQTLAGLFGVSLLVSPLMRTFLVTDRQQLKLFTDCGGLAVPIVAFWVGNRMGLDLKAAVGLYGILGATNYGVSFALAWHCARVGIRS